MDEIAGEMARQQRALEAQRWQQREANRLAALEEHIRRGGTEDDFSYTMSDPAVGQ